MKKIILTVCIAITTAIAGSAQEKITDIALKMQEEALTERYAGNYQKAELLIEQLIHVIDAQPAEVQAECVSMKGDIYYDLARYRSLQNDRQGATEAFENAVKSGWNDYEFTSADSDLENARKDKKFKALLESIRTA